MTLSIIPPDVHAYALREARLGSGPPSKLAWSYLAVCIERDALKGTLEPTPLVTADLWADFRRVLDTNEPPEGLTTGQLRQALAILGLTCP